MARNVIKLLGDPIQSEEDKAAEAITPGHLVGFDGSGNLVKHATAAQKTAVRIALERDELGDGIDDAYAADDVVKVGQFGKGQRFYGFLASGYTVAKDDHLESAGNGAFRHVAKGGASGLVRAVEAVTNGGQTTATRIRLEVL